MTMKIFISKKSCKMYENTVKSLEFMPSLTFTRTLLWANLESLLGRF